MNASEKTTSNSFQNAASNTGNNTGNNLIKLAALTLLTPFGWFGMVAAGIAVSMVIETVDESAIIENEDLPNVHGAPVQIEGEDGKIYQVILLGDDIDERSYKTISQPQINAPRLGN